MRLGVLALLLALCACAGPRAKHSGPTYTRSALLALPTSELAALFLDPADAATIERHAIGEPWNGPDSSWSVTLYARPRPIGEDLCGQRIYFASLLPIKGSARDARGELPAWMGRDTRIHGFPRLALAPQCRDRPGLRFARVEGVDATEEEGVAILRALAAARSAAAGPGPLPFRLSCVDWSRKRDFACPADPRATLADLPLHQAFTVERHPFPNNCDSSSRDEGDAVEIGGPDDDDIWDVRLRHLGTERAEVVLIRQFPRTLVKC